MNLFELVNKIRKHKDVIAVKVWTREDVKLCLSDKGFLESEKNVDTVLSENLGFLEKVLSECTDGDWEAIYHAIDNCTDLQKGEENEEGNK